MTPEQKLERALTAERVYQAMHGDPRPDVFLEWIADRLVRQHGEPPNVDFVLALRRYARALKNAYSGRSVGNDW